MKLEPVVVVEGEHDRRAVLHAVEADVVITGGFALTDEVISRLRQLQERRGIIILTDPDYMGDVIRRTLQRKIPGAQHAYVSREDSFQQGDVGVENAKPETIQRALSQARKYSPLQEDPYLIQDLYKLGLAGRKDSAHKRAEVSRILNIGYGNAKKFCRDLNAFRITFSELEKALIQIGIIEPNDSSERRMGQ